MSNVIQAALAFAGGMGLGLLYFGGLWLTLQRLPTTRFPAAWALMSFYGRIAATALGFYVLMDGNWARMLACLLGFILIRALLVRRWAPRGTHLASKQSLAP